MNDAMIQLLTIRALVDAHRQRLISDTEITLHQNEAKVSKAVKEIKAHYLAALSDAESSCVVAVREAETVHSVSTREVQCTCITTMRKAEAASTVEAFSIQQVHWETMKTLEIMPSRRKEKPASYSCRPT